jgi:hypothetical protein
MQPFVIRGPALAAALFLLTGCAARAPDPAELPAQEFAGHLTIAEGEYWFEPCSRRGERWWVTLTDRSIDQVRSALADGRIADGGRAFVRWMAALTDERLIGPGGPALLTREVLELRRPGDADCGR